MFSLFLQKVVFIPSWMYVALEQQMQTQFYFYYRIATIWVCNTVGAFCLFQNKVGKGILFALKF